MLGTRRSSRRTFLKTSAAAAAVSLAPRAIALASAAETTKITPPLHQFGYGDVHLLDGPAREQFDSNHAFYRALNEDSLLKPFRQRAGLPRTGEEMGGWYSWAPLSDLESPATTASRLATALDSIVSGLARDYAATGDTATQEKVHRLVRGLGGGTHAPLLG